MLGTDSFIVTANNNVGSGEVTLLTDSTTSVILDSQSIIMPSTMWDQPKVSIRFECDVTQSIRQCFVDTIRVNGTAIATTLTTQSGFDSQICFGDGTKNSAGVCNNGVFYNATANTIFANGNWNLSGVGGGGVTDHSALTNLEWASAGHTFSSLNQGMDLEDYNLSTRGNVSIGGDLDVGRNLTIGGAIGIATKFLTEKLQVAGNIFLQNDSDKIFFGEMKDASIYYDNTNNLFVIDPDEVGDANLFVDGDMNTTGQINGVTITTKNTVNNFAIGTATTMESITTGVSNVAFGQQALRENTEGSSNVCFGSFSCAENTIGISNMGHGGFALQNNIDGDSNVAIGAGALRGNGAVTNSPDDNICLGASSCFRLDTGVQNIMIGTATGNDLTTGNRNIFIGYRTADAITSTNDLLLIDNRDRVDLGDSQANSIISGVMRN